MQFEVKKIVVVTRQTRLEESIRRFNTLSQTRFFIESRGQSFDDYQLEYDNYCYSRDSLLKNLPGGIKVQVIDRSFLPNFLFGPGDLVITLGQDGLVVNTAKYLDGQPVLAVNPDPERFDGILLPFLPADTPAAVENLENGRIGSRQITMGQVDLNDGQRLLAFNDFFVGVKSHTSARYSLHYGDKSERQSSSGVLISTPAGSTGWLSSVYNMAAGFSRFCGFETALQPVAVPWHEKKLVFVVREPFLSRWSGIDLVAGTIEPGLSLRISSHTAAGGVIFSDGIEGDFIEFNSGSEAEISVSSKTTNLLTALDETETGPPQET